ncbi:MAG: nucleoside phosphorylase [Solirubrobacteraceae bacterium]
MPFPNFADKHAHDAVFSPADAVAAFLSSRVRVPQGVVLTYQPALAEHLRATGAELRTGFPGPWRQMWRVKREGRAPVGVVNGFGVGAPAVALVVEELIALGAKRVINLGTAGCLQPGLDFGQVVLCTSAVRDEGVSHHYLPSAKFAYPSDELSRLVSQELEARQVKFTGGATWSTDAVFRETVAEARSYQAEGIVTVEMEAAALFAVGAFRGAEVAAAFTVSDQVLPDTPWAHAFHADAVRESSVALLEAVIDVLAGPPADDQADLDDRGDLDDGWSAEQPADNSSFDC